MLKYNHRKETIISQEISNKYHRKSQISLKLINSSESFKFLYNYKKSVIFQLY